jgi:uncharacterized protein
MEIRDSHVFITGASRGIGAAMATSFAAAGAKVSVAARSTDALEKVAARVGGKSFVVDLNDATQVDALIPRVEAEAGPIDILINNAGLETQLWFHNEPPARIREVARLNFEVPLMLTRAVLPGMLERGKGHIVCTSSAAGSAGFPGLVAYSGTKAGLNNFIAALRLELRDTPIKTTLVAPGPVDTQMWDHLEDQKHLEPMLKRLRLLQLIPKKSPEKLASLTVAAVAANRRHVRVPKRNSVTYWLPESSRRLFEAVLTGVPFVPPKQ